MPQVWTGQAPGRLDFLGGVADYSGSLVLQTPIRGTTRVGVSCIDEQVLCIESTQQGEYVVPLDAASDFKNTPHWARYVLGCFVLFNHETDWQPERGLHFQIESDVPTSMGVSSSAALEVATLRALQNASGITLPGTELAKMAQRAENEIVGAPCGLMDQLASAYGLSGALLPILCRPDKLREPVPLPQGVLIAGWPSGVKHAVSDSPYATARCAAFMGKTILEQHFNRQLDFVTQLAPSQVRNMNESTLPATMTGGDFLRKFGGVDDPLSVVEPQRSYPLRAGALFPIEENFRCESAALMLSSMTTENKQSTLRAVGEFMFQSHAGYSSIGLDCPETDTMVESVRAQVGNGFYGARVSGGGSGGTVVVLLECSALPDLEVMAKEQSLIL